MTDVVLDDTQGCALISDFTNDLQKQSRIPEITGNVNGNKQLAFTIFIYLVYNINTPVHNIQSSFFKGSGFFRMHVGASRPARFG